MTTRLSTAPRDAKPLSWWAAIAFPGALPYTDTPRKRLRRGRRPPVRPLAFNQDRLVQARGGIYLTLGVGNMLTLDTARLLSGRKIPFST